MGIAARLDIYHPDDDRSGTARDQFTREIKEAYDTGFEAGAKAGAEAAAQDHADQQDQLSARMVEMIEDLRTERTEVQAQVLSGLSPLIRALSTRLMPMLAERGMIDIIEKAVRDALAQRPAAMPQVVCAPELLPALGPLSEAHPDSFGITPDPALTPLEARIDWDDGFDRIDLQPIFDAVEDCLDRLDDLAGPDAPTIEETRDVG